MLCLRYEQWRADKTLQSSSRPAGPKWDAGQAVWKEVTGLFPAWSADVPATARNGVVNGELRRMDLVSTSHNLDGRLIDPTVVDGPGDA